VTRFVSAEGRGYDPEQAKTALRDRTGLMEDSAVVQIEALELD